MQWNLHRSSPRIQASLPGDKSKDAMKSAKDESKGAVESAKDKSKDAVESANDKS